MKLIIEIDDKVYGLLKYFEDGLGLDEKKDDNDDVKTALMRAVLNGTLLPKGHWIIMGDRCIKCSECGHITKTESPDIYNFCMVCGANMSEIPTSSKPEISSYYGLKSYVKKRSE